MGWGRPPPHSLLLVDRLVEDDSCVAIGNEGCVPLESSIKFRWTFSWTRFGLSAVRVHQTLTRQRIAESFFFMCPWQDSEHINRISDRLPFSTNLVRICEEGFRRVPQNDTLNERRHVRVALCQANRLRPKQFPRTR